MKLLGFLSADAIVLDMDTASKEDAIRQLIKAIVKTGDVAEEHEPAIFKAVMAREGVASTGLGEGMAIPHVKDCPQVEGLTGAFGRVPAPGIDFNAIDRNPVQLIFMILGGEGTTPDHLEVLKKLAELRMNEHFLRFLRNAKDEAGVAEIIKEMAVA